MLLQALRNTDARVADDEPVTPAFLFAALLWPAYCRALAVLQAQGVDAGRWRSSAPPTGSPCTRPSASRCRGGSRCRCRKSGCCSRASAQRQRKRVFRLLAHPRFRAAFDFLELRLAAIREIAEDVAFWREAQAQSPSTLAAALERSRARRAKAAMAAGATRRRRSAAGVAGARPARPARRRNDRRAVRAYVGLGGNVGDVDATLREAMWALDSLPQTSICARRACTARRRGAAPSSRTSSMPWSQLQTRLAARELLDALLDIETRFGRDRAPRARRWGPRTLDLDLLLYGDEQIDEPGLHVPHPHLHERAFVLVPLAEIAPESGSPGVGRSRDATGRRGSGQRRSKRSIAERACTRDNAEINANAHAADRAACCAR